MRIQLVRHALPMRSEPGQGADPDLSAAGAEQAARLPGALARFRVARVVSSPQRRAVQTAQPLASARGLAVEIDDRLAEYDRELGFYVPVEQLRTEHPQEWERLRNGLLPTSVDEGAFRARVRAGFADIVAAADADDTVVAVCHGGVINAMLQDILGTARLLSFPLDYASVSSLRYSSGGRATVESVNGTEHVWDLLPRNLG